MSKKVWDGDYDINTDWGGKDTDGRPLTGEMVQDVIKSEFKRLDTGKVGYITDIWRTAAGQFILPQFNHIS
jgi:hypothetical protein